MAMQPDMFASDPYWTDEYEDQFRSAMGYPVAQSFALPGELGKSPTDPGGQPAPPPPAPPPGGPTPAPGGSTMGPRGRNMLGVFGVPTQEETPAMAPPLSPEEEAQIQIDLPADGVTPFGEEGIEIDQPAAPQDIGQQLFGLQTVENIADASRKPGDPYTGVNSPDVGERSDALVDLAQRDPDAYLKQQAHEQSILDDKRRAEEARIVREDSEREVRNSQSHVEAIQRAQQASADLENDLAELQKQKIDPDRWMNSRSSWQTVSAFIAVIAGGLAQSASGGRNTGLDIINKSIDDDIGAQVENLRNGRALLDQKRGLVAEMYARTGDLHRAQETARIAMREQAIRALEVEMQQYDPKGTAARNLAQVRMQAMSDAQKAKQQYAKDQLDFATKEADLKNKQLDALAKEKKLQGGGAAQKFTPEYFAAKGLPTPPFPMSEKEHRSWMGDLKTTKELGKDDSKAGKTEAQLRKEEADAQKAEAEAAAAKTGYAIKNPETGKIITNPDGSPVLEMDATKRNRASAIIEAAQNIRRLADRMAELKKKYGGAIDTLGSDEAQELKGLASMMNFEIFKGFDLGAPSEGDKALAEDAKGGVNVTSFVRDATPGWLAFADGVEKKANAALRNSGYTGPALKFTREADAPKANTDIVDDIGKKLETAFVKTTKKTDNPLAQQSQKISSAVFEPLNQDAEAEFQKLAAYAEQTNDMGDRAKKYLKGLATKSVNHDVRARAQSILDALPGSNERKDKAR